MRIAAMLRIRNESRWIAEVIESVLPLCGRVFILDDHSTDNTREICRSYGGVDVFASPFTSLDETRDKNWLLERVIAWRPDWVLCIDGDEVLEREGPRKIRDLCMAALGNAYALRVCYLWDSPDQVRVDGVYGRFYRPSLFRLTDPSIRFRTTSAGGNLHCSSIPQELFGSFARTEIKLKHYGYIDRELRLRKYEWYSTVDPNNANEDRYRHIVQGDVPEVPANAQLMHAGPLRLASFTA